LDPVDPAEEAKPDSKPFGYEFNEDGTFFGGDRDADGGRDEEEAEPRHEQDSVLNRGTSSFGDLDGADHDDLDEKYPPEDFFPTPSTIRLDLQDESEEESHFINVEDLEDDDIEVYRGEYLGPEPGEAREENTNLIIKKEEVESRSISTKKEESWSWPTTMPERKQHPISLMQDLESYGYRLNDEGTVWIAPPRMEKVAAVKPSRPVVFKKEEFKLYAVKVEEVKEAEEADHEPEPEPFGYTFNDDGTFYGE